MSSKKQGKTHQTSRSKGKSISNGKKKARSFKLSGEGDMMGVKGSFSLSSRSAPATRTLVVKTGSGAVSTTRGGTEVVKGSSLLASIVPPEAGDGDSSTSFNINPGISEVFPQLSQVANLYSEYEFKRLTVTYVPTCPTTTIGQLGMGFNNNALAVGPGSLTELMSYEGSTLNPYWTPVTFDVPRDGIKRFIRNSPVPGGSDAKTYDLGLMTVIFSPANFAQDTVGYLILDYECHLSKRVLGSPLGCQMTSNFSAIGYAELHGGGSFANLCYIMKSDVYGHMIVGNPNGFTSNENGFTLPPGYWRIDCFGYCSNPDNTGVAMGGIVPPEYTSMGVAAMPVEIFSYFSEGSVAVPAQPYFAANFQTGWAFYVSTEALTGLDAGASPTAFSISAFDGGTPAVSNPNARWNIQFMICPLSPIDAAILGLPSTSSSSSGPLEPREVFRSFRRSSSLGKKQRVPKPLQLPFPARS